MIKSLLSKLVEVLKPSKKYAKSSFWFWYEEKQPELRIK